MKKLLLISILFLFRIFDATAMMSELPDDMVLEVMRYLPKTDALNFSRCCHRLYILADNKIPLIKRHRALYAMYQNKQPLFTYQDHRELTFVLSASIEPLLRSLVIERESTYEIMNSKTGLWEPETLSFKCITSNIKGTRNQGVYFKNLLKQSCRDLPQFFKDDRYHQLLFVFKDLIMFAEHRLYFDRQIKFGQHFIIEKFDEITKKIIIKIIE